MMFKMNKTKYNFQKMKEFFRWKTLDGYILRKFLQSFFFSLSLLMVIIVVFDLSENIQRFLENKTPVSKIIVGYYFNFIPYFANLFIALFTFISVIWFTSQLSQRNEIVAILSNGINFYRLILPYLVGAFIIAGFSFGMSNFIVPKTNRNLEQFKNQHFYKRNQSFNNLHLRNSTNSYIYLGHWNKEEETGYDFTYEEIGKEYTRYKIYAREIKYNSETEKWLLTNFTERRIMEGEEFIERGNEKDTIFNITPLNLTKDEGIVSVMNYKELSDYIKQEKENGSPLVKYYVMEKNKRMANALGTIIMTLLGMSVASRKNNRGSGIHLFIGMGMAFSFIFLQQVSDVFSVSGNLSPALGAWMPNILFLLLCIGMLKFTQK